MWSRSTRKAGYGVCFFFHPYAGSKNSTEVIRFGGQWLYPLSPPPVPLVFKTEYHSVVPAGLDLTV